MQEKYKDNFQLWARECVRITDKLTGLPVPFELNMPQRRVLAMLEEMRLRGLPIRLIMLKARQWGGSTLIQVYMAWMQLVRRKGWNSLICAHVRDASAQIRGMYARLLREYPEGMKTGQPRDWAFLPFERSQSVSWIPAREAQVAVATSLSPNSVRGGNFAMAHLSEVAFWADGDERAASEIVRTVCGSVAREPDTLVVMESTANGTDNYFYREWRRAVDGKSDKRPVFVPWHEIGIYSRKVEPSERPAVEASFDDYERAMLESGIALEKVAWYHDKRREYATHEAMMAEFPSTPEEAFANASLQTLLRPEQVPERSESAVASSGTCLGVLLVSADGTGQLLSLFALGRDMLVPLSDESLDGLSLSRAVGEAVCRCRQAGARLTVAEAPRDGQPSHARWCASRASRLGTDMAYDDDERSYAVADGRFLTHAADCYAALAEEGKVAEVDPEARLQLLRCNPVRPWQTPMALTRLVAARLHALADHPSVALADLLP